MYHTRTAYGQIYIGISGKRREQNESSNSIKIKKDSKRFQRSSSQIRRIYADKLSGEPSGRNDNKSRDTIKRHQHDKLQLSVKVRRIIMKQHKFWAAAATFCMIMACITGKRHK